MGTPFSPTRLDVERYRSMRALCVELNQRIVKTVPGKAYEEIGDAIGIRHNGVLVFDNEDVSSVLMDCCVHDWFENGKNLVQRYSEAHPAKPGTDESYILNACLQAKYRILLVKSAMPGAGLYCKDGLNNEELFLMDLALSRSLKDGNAVLATRTMPLGEYWMTGGAGLPINSKKAMLDALSRFEREKQKPPEGRASLALTIVRLCLAAGAADYIAYESAEATAKTPRSRPRMPGFKFKRHR